MEPKQFYNNSIFWVELDRIRPNPYQPRKEFDQVKLSDLAESIRQYGVLQPLVVTRHEENREDGGLSVHYELIVGERRLRASKLAGLTQVPVIIRSGTETGKVKLEIAIIENIQREDLNPIDRAKAFARLVEEFDYKHTEVAKKVGKSREYVSNTLRLLSMPEDMQEALVNGKITEGHSRPLLMLIDKPAEQSTLFKEIVYKKLTVRETESIARHIAFEKVRKRKELNPEMIELERNLTDILGTRVHIEQAEVGGKVTIDYFSPEDLNSIAEHIQRSVEDKKSGFLERLMKGSQSEKSENEKIVDEENAVKDSTAIISSSEDMIEEIPSHVEKDEKEAEPVDDRSDEEREKDDEDLYSVKNFSI